MKKEEDLLPKRAVGWGCSLIQEQRLLLNPYVNMSLRLLVRYVRDIVTAEGSV